MANGENFGKCENCKWWVRTDGPVDLKQSSRTCKRFPGQVFLVPTPTTLCQMKMSQILAQMSPPATWECGEFDPREPIQN